MYHCTACQGAMCLQCETTTGTCASEVEIFRAGVGSDEAQRGRTRQRYPSDDAGAVNRAPCMPSAADLREERKEERGEGKEASSLCDSASNLPGDGPPSARLAERVRTTASRFVANMASDQPPRASASSVLAGATIVGKQRGDQPRRQPRPAPPEPQRPPPHSS